MPNRIPARIAWLAVPTTAVFAAATWLTVSTVTRATASLPASPQPASSSPASSALASSLPVTSAPAHPGASGSSRPDARAVKPIVLSAQARARCAPAASACADLSAHVTWLQSGSRITYGPVRMEPGGKGDPTPRGVFHVAWKAGAHYISTSYGVPIPYAVFFATGGVAFHEGSLTTSSHGCIHLTMADARYYNEHLPVGAEVAVF
ncbi:MAG TPA: L,D-transpeptidase [Trebonia sp.]|nr:L,D-transpeptidase [Trebonia sp.]